MKRLRDLVALLGCLAVLAGSVSVVAEATAAVRTSFDRGATDGQPCSHCDECDGVPCPKPAVACLQACATPAAAVAVAMPVLPELQAGSAAWSIRTAALSGLSRPPDPFPPRP